MVIHRGLACLLSLTLTSWYCTHDHGLCRPLPLKSYLLGQPYSDKFVRDPVSLAVTLTIVSAIVLMQVGIELKKRRAARMELETLQLAVEAGKNLAVARFHHQQELRPFSAFDVKVGQLLSRVVIEVTYQLIWIVPST